MNYKGLTLLLTFCATVIVISGVIGNKIAFSCCKNIYECYNVSAYTWKVIYYPATPFCTSACTGRLYFKPNIDTSIRVSNGVGAGSVFGDACFTSNIVCGTVGEGALGMFGCYIDTETPACTNTCNGNKTVDCDGNTVTSCQSI